MKRCRNMDHLPMAKVVFATVFDENSAPGRPGLTSALASGARGAGAVRLAPRAADDSQRRAGLPYSSRAAAPGSPSQTWRPTAPEECAVTYCFEWCRRGGSNSGPTDYESVALPLSYVGKRARYSAGRPGRQPGGPHRAIASRWVHPSPATRKRGCRGRGSGGRGDQFLRRRGLADRPDQGAHFGAGGDVAHGQLDAQPGLPHIHQRQAL